MWDAIKYVSGFFSLTAFIVAAVVMYLNYKARQKTKWLTQVPERDKIKALDGLLDRFSISTSGLTKDQKFDLAMEQIRKKHHRYSLALLFCSIVACLLFVLWLVSITRAKQTPQFSTFSGYVAYKTTPDSGKAITPVQGADVQIVGTELRTTTTATGEFKFNVSSETKIDALNISRAGKSYMLQTKEYPDNIFRIPVEPKILKSVERLISSADWEISTNSECSTPDNDKYRKSAQFSLIKDVRKEGDYSDLWVRIWCADDVDIISARKLEPPGGLKVQDVEDYSKAQKWQFPIRDDITRIRISLCLGAAAEKSTLEKTDLQGVYWFEKVE